MVLSTLGSEVVGLVVVLLGIVSVHIALLSRAAVHLRLMIRSWTLAFQLRSESLLPMVVDTRETDAGGGLLVQLRGELPLDLLGRSLVCFICIFNASS